jgi:GNAT superfamily N-acetyltransferase
VLEAELDEIEAFYARHGVPTVVDLCPLADSSLKEMLGQRGYRLTDFSQIWIRKLSPEERFEEVAGVEVRAVGPEEADLWARTVEQGFTGEEEIPEERIERGKGLFQMGYARCYLARIAGVPEGGAAMIQQDGLVTLFATSTRPRARRRGVYTALLRARLAEAAAGSDLAVVITQPGSDSQRNAERMGFRLAYTKVELTLGAR